MVLAASETSLSKIVSDSWNLRITVMLRTPLKSWMVKVCTGSVLALNSRVVRARLDAAKGVEPLATAVSGVFHRSAGRFEAARPSAPITASSWKIYHPQFLGRI